MPDFTYLETTFERPQKALDDAERFTGYSKVRVGGHMILKTSPTYNRGWLARQFYRNSVLSEEGHAALEGKDVSALSLSDWSAVADADGMPPVCVASLWAVENVKNTRAQFFANVALSNHEMNLIQMLADQDADARPGKYRPIILEGDAGCGKTQAVISYAALTGKPYMEVRGLADDDRALTDKLEGGDAPSTDTRSVVMKDCAYYGIFDTSPQKAGAVPWEGIGVAAMAEFYRACGSLIKSGAAVDMFSAYQAIPDQEWDKIAKIAGMPEPGDAIAVKKLGDAERGRRIPGGAIVNFDEINMFSEFTEIRATNNFNNHSRYDQIGLCYTGTMNPPSEKFPNRRYLAYDSLSRVEVRSAQKPALEQVTDIALRFLGYSGTSEERKREQLLISEALASDNDLTADDRAGLIKLREKKRSYHQLLTEKSAAAISLSLASFHCMVEAQTGPDSKLHPSDYGSTASPGTIDLRTLIDSFFGTLGPALVRKAVAIKPELAAAMSFSSPAEGQEFLGVLTPKAVAEVVHSSLRRAYVQRLTFSKPDLDSGITPNAKFKAKDSSLPVLEELINQNGCSVSALEKAIEINRAESAPEWAREIARTVSGQVNDKAANPRGLLEAIAEQAPELADAIARKDENIGKKAEDLDGFSLSDVALVAGAKGTYIPFCQRVLDDVTTQFASDKHFAYDNSSTPLADATAEKASALAPELLKLFRDEAIPLQVPLTDKGVPMPQTIPVDFIRNAYGECLKSHKARFKDAVGDGLNAVILIPMRLTNGKLIAFCGGDLTLPTGAQKTIETWITEDVLMEYMQGAILDRDTMTHHKKFPAADTVKPVEGFEGADALKWAKMEHRRFLVYTTPKDPVEISAETKKDKLSWRVKPVSLEAAVPVRVADGQAAAITHDGGLAKKTGDKVGNKKNLQKSLL